MVTVRIYDYEILRPEMPLTSRTLALDLRNLLELLGARSVQSTWTVSPVKIFYPTPNSFEDNFEATGQGGDRLEEYARNRSSVSGTVLAELANATGQVTWGEFTAILPQQENNWITIRAIDSTFYEVSTDDMTVLDKIKSIYKDVRAADAPVTAAPIPPI